MDRPLDNQQLQSKRRKSWLKATLSLSALIVIWLLISASFTRSVSRQEIRTAKVVMGNLDTSLPATGVVIPLIEETVSSQINSQIKKVFVEPGQQVAAGTLLMQLNTATVDLDIANIKEEIALKENQIETSELNLKRSTNDSKGRLSLLSVDLDSRKTRHDRLKQLANAGATSAHDLKEAQLNVKRTEIEIEQLKQSIVDNKAATRAEIEGIKLEKSMLQKSLKEKQRLLEGATVIAPIDGSVVWLKSEEGSAVSNGESLVRIADTHQFKIEISISDYYADQLYQGMTAKIVSSDKSIHGKITSIYAGETQGVLKLIMLMGGDEKNKISLRQQQRIEVNLITGRVENTLLVDNGPFANGAGSLDVFLINNDLATKTKVVLGASNRNYIQVKRGLSVGDEIIISDTRKFSTLNQFNVDS